MSQLIPGNELNITNITKGATPIEGLYLGSELLWPTLPMTWSKYTMNVTIDVAPKWAPTIGKYLSWDGANSNVLYASDDGITWSVYSTLPTNVTNINAIETNSVSTAYPIIFSGSSEALGEYVYGSSDAVNWTQLYSITPRNSYTVTVSDGNKFTLGIKNTGGKIFCIDSSDAVVEITDVRYEPPSGSGAGDSRAYCQYQCSIDEDSVATALYYYDHSEGRSYYKAYDGSSFYSIPRSGLIGYYVKYIVSTGGNNLLYISGDYILRIKDSSITGFDISGLGVRFGNVMWVDTYKLYIASTSGGVYTSADGFHWRLEYALSTSQRIVYNAYNNEFILKAGTGFIVKGTLS